MTTHQPKTEIEELLTLDQRIKLEFVYLAIRKNRNEILELTRVPRFIAEYLTSKSLGDEPSAESIDKLMRFVIS